jgi:hypothetical protein
MYKTRTIKITKLPTNTENQFIEVSVHFNEGGINYATYDREAKGFYLSLKPITIDPASPGVVSFMMFSGGKTLILEAKRFSQKTLEQLAKTAMQDPKYQPLLEHVLAKNNLKAA